MKKYLHIFLFFLFVSVGSDFIFGQATFYYSGSIVTWAVPCGVTSITIDAYGAQGGAGTLSGSSGGLGARAYGTFGVTPGQVLKILVGGQGGAGYNGGGGGGSFVTDISNNPLCIAGGGGGGEYDVYDYGTKPGTTSNTGQNGYCGGCGGAVEGWGGSGGGGGGTNSQYSNSGSGGGGLTGNGTSAVDYYGYPVSCGGSSFINGGAGGCSSGSGGAGGFGGGGGADWTYWTGGGGGGGYSGGGGGSYYGNGGGGGSYNGIASGVQSGDGVIYISYSADVTGPTQNSLTVNSNCWIADNAHNYTITETATDPGGVGGGTYGMLALINYQGAHAGNYGGYFAWNTSLALLNAAGYTVDQSACAGGGYVGKAANYGNTTITLVSGSTSVSGNQRTVNFVVRPNATFPIFADNDISFYTMDGCSNPTGWNNWDINFTSGAAPGGNQTSYGAGSWIGYAYTWTGNAGTPLTTTNYFGYVTEAAIFNRNNGVGSLTGVTTFLNCAPVDNFSVRYMMNMNFTAGTYSFTVGADDGVRLSVDGGSTWLINQWIDQGYTTYTSACVVLSGSTNLILEYYENGGGSQVSFSYASCCTPPAITGQPNSPTICTGNTAALSVTASGSATLNYQWQQMASNCATPTNVGTNSPNYTTAVLTTGTYYYRCVVTNSCGTTTSNCGVVTVNGTSTNPTSATASTNPICNGGSTVLTLNGGGGGTGTVIKWYSTNCGTGLVGTGNNLSVSPASTTTYYGRYEDPAPCSNNTACQSITITVNQKSTNPTSATASVNPICNGGSTVLTLNGGGGGTGTVIKWYSTNCGTGLVGTGNNLSVSPASTTTYYGRYEDPAPCSFNTSCASITITVNIISTNPTSATASVNPICNGGSTVLTLNGGGGGTGTVIKWYSTNCGTGLVGTGNNLSVSPASTTTYYGRYEDPAPCSNNTTCQSITINVTPQPSTSNAGADQSLCNVTTTTLAGNSPAVGTGAWSVVSGTATITTPSSPTSGVTGLVVGASATLRWTISNSPCSASTDDVIISVSAIPTIANAGADQTICGTTATLAGNTPGVGTGIWTLISGTATITTPTSPTSGLTGLSGVSTLRWTISSSPCTASYDDMAITANPKPTASAGSNQTICNGSNIVIGGSPTASGGTAPYTYSWTTCNATLSSCVVANPSANPSSNTTYNITVTDSKGCVSTSSAMSITVNTCSGIGVRNEGAYLYISSNTYVYINDGATAGTGGYINNSVGGNDGRIECQSNSAIIKLKGNWTNNSSTGNADNTGNNVFKSGTNFGEVQFIGVVAQIINGSTPTNFTNLTINNTGGGVTLNPSPAATTTVTGVFNLSYTGLVFTSATNLLTLTTTASVLPYNIATTGAGSVISYVVGPMKKQCNIGNDFVFPVGKGAKWEPIGVFGVAGAASDFQAEYFDADYGNHAVVSPINDVSGFEWWELAKVAGAGSAQVRLYWEDKAWSHINDCTMGAGGDLVVAHWGTPTANAWNSEGNSATNNNACTVAGWLQSSNTLSTFSPFTFGSKSGAVNPLPLELLSFTALCDGHSAIIQWSTATETNVSHFTLEKSCDGTTYEPIASINAAGNSTTVKHYSYVDVNSGSGCYYRLKETDLNGTVQTLSVIAANCSESPDFSLVNVYPNPAQNNIYISYTASKSDKISISLTDILGQKLNTLKIIPDNDGLNITTMNVSDYAEGIYFLVTSDGNKYFVKRIEKNK